MSEWLDRLDLQHARAWVWDEIDRETAIWADKLARDLCRWCEKRRDKIRPRADMIAKAVEPYLGLPRKMGTCERVLGRQIFH